MATEGTDDIRGPQVVGAPESVISDAAAAADQPVGSSPSDEVDAESLPRLPQETDTTDAEQLKAKIIMQVEYYFSDGNLRNDMFLMNHVSKDNGFVSISLISSFRKMKKLTEDTSLIVEALKESSKLVVSKNETRVKRLHPLPLEIKHPNVRTVIVENLPEDHSEENIRKIFGEVGNINVIFICDPNVDKDLKLYKRAEKIVSGKVHALLEYETVEAAEKAVATLNNEKDWRNGMQVQLLSKRLGYELGKKSKKGCYSENRSTCGSDAGVGDTDIFNRTFADSHGDKDGVNYPKERNKHKSRNPRSMGCRSLGSHGNESSIGDTSKTPPGPKMPDGTRGFTMGRGRPL